MIFWTLNVQTQKSHTTTTLIRLTHIDNIKSSFVKNKHVLSAETLLITAST